MRGVYFGAGEFGHGSRLTGWSNPNVTPVARRGPDSVYVTRVDLTNPGRPHPAYSVDTRAFTSGTATQAGGVRNSRQFWNEWQKLNPQSISPENAKLIKKGLAPKIDDTWVQVFPEQAPYMHEKLLHHHVNHGRYAIPVPESTHVGSGGAWHGR